MRNKELEQLQELLFKASIEYGGALEVNVEISESEHEILQDAWVIIHDVIKEREFQNQMAMVNFDK